MARDAMTFIEFLQTFRRGELLSVAHEQWDELMNAIRITGGKGEFTLKLSFKVNAAGQLETVPLVTIKKPRKPLGTGIYYLTEDGALTRRDPAQEELFDELEARRERADLQ